MMAAATGYVSLNGDYFVVARYLGAASLGLYTRAYQLMSLPIRQVSNVITAVLFPAFAEIQSEPARLRRAYLGSVSVAALATFPLLTGVAVAAPEILRGILGPSWQGATVAVQVLCVGGFCKTIQALSSALTRAKGAVYLQAARNLLYAFAVIAASLIGKSWGIEGVAVAMVGAMVLMYLMMAHLGLKLVNTGWTRFFAAQRPAALLALLVAIAAYGTASVLRQSQLPDLVTLAGVVAVAGVTCAIVAWVFPRRRLDGATLWAIERIEESWSRRSSALKWRAAVEQDLSGSSFSDP